jgi:hypothetical protein
VLEGIVVQDAIPTPTLGPRNALHRGLALGTAKRRLGLLGGFLRRLLRGSLRDLGLSTVASQQQATTAKVGLAMAAAEAAETA